MNKDLKFGKNEPEPIPDNPGFFRKRFGRQAEQALPENADRIEANISPMPSVQTQTATPLLGASLANDTYIGKNCAINGDIQAESDLRLGGLLTGNITGKQRITISGRLDGNASGKSVSVLSGVATGDLTAEETATLDAKSLVIGNLTCKDADIDGKLKGDIHAEGTAVIRRNAVVHGNITAANIDTEKGAVINGHVSIICPKSEKEIFALPRPEDQQNTEAEAKPDNPQKED